MDLLHLSYTALIPKLNESFSAHLLQDEHYSRVLDVFIRSFCDAEPMTKYINMKYNEFRPFAEIVTQKAIIDRLSSVIIENKTGNVAGLSLVEDLCDPVVIPVLLSKKFNPIFNLLEQLSASYLKLYPPAKNQVSHLFISAVSESYRGLGLSTQANYYAMKLAKQNNFNFMLSELTNYLNEQGIIHYLSGYKERIGAISYKEFIFENIKPFKYLSGEAHAFIWRLPQAIQCL